VRYRAGRARESGRWTLGDDDGAWRCVSSEWATFTTRGLNWVMGCLVELDFGGVAEA
jgi:hypothetical protein